jgi:hypothetical protein
MPPMEIPAPKPGKKPTRRGGRKVGKRLKNQKVRLEKKMLQEQMEQMDWTWADEQASSGSIEDCQMSADYEL